MVGLKQLMSRRAKRTLAERVFLTAAASIVVAVGLLGALELIVWAPQRIESLKHDALQGDVDAAFTWGEMCSMTAGVNEDYAEAARWYRLAAEQGHAPSQERLASLYNHGQGVPLNNVEAYKWMDLAVAHSQGREQEHHSFYRDIIGKEMTPEQISEAQRRACEWKPKK